MTVLTNKLAVLSASGVALAGGTAVLAPAAATANPAQNTVVDNCAGKGVVAPRDYTLYCGDGNNTLLKLQWKDWGAAAATAAGKMSVDNCRPSCAAGKDRIYRATAKLSRLKNSEYHRITVHFTGKVPGGSHRTATYKVGKHGPLI